MRHGLCVVLLLLGAACESKEPPPRKEPWTPRSLPDPEAIAIEFDLPQPTVNSAFGLLRRMRPLPVELETTLALDPKERVQLGHSLFFEKRLSLGQQTSCQDCHVLAHHGVDGKLVPVGNDGELGVRNTPTVFNVAGQALFFWDGRADSLEQQARGPLLNAIEMALEEEQQALDVLRSMPEYVTAFERAFPETPEAVSFENLVRALAAYERHLVTAGPWDRFLAGDDASISRDALRGFVLMVHHGCVACHTGATLSGGLEKLGVKHPWPNQADLGRFQHSGNEMDKMKFRAPGLRNVAHTAPYFHDASEPTLTGAVRKMAYHQLGNELSDRDVTSIVAFLETLSGELPSELVGTPELPPSTAKTPAPRRRSAKFTPGPTETTASSRPRRAPTAPTSTRSTVAP